MQRSFPGYGNHPFSEPICYIFYHCFVSRAIVVDPLEQIRCFTVSAIRYLHLRIILVLNIGLCRVLELGDPAPD